MKIETVKCDECGVVKEESNHWLHIDVHQGTADATPWINLGRHDLMPAWERRDLCGQGCFHRHLDKLLFPEKPGVLTQAQRDALASWPMRPIGGSDTSGGPYVMQTGELPDPGEDDSDIF